MTALTNAQINAWLEKIPGGSELATIRDLGNQPPKDTEDTAQQSRNQTNDTKSRAESVISTLSVNSGVLGVSAVLLVRSLTLNKSSNTKQADAFGLSFKVLFMKKRALRILFVIFSDFPPLVDVRVM